MNGLRKGIVKGSLIIKEEDFNITYIKAFYSKILNRKELLFVKNNNNKIIGFIDFKYLCSFYSDRVINYSKNIYYVQSITPESTIKNILQHKPDSIVLCEIEKDVVEYYQVSNPNRIEIYELAMSVLPVFCLDFLHVCKGYGKKITVYVELTDEQIINVFGKNDNLHSTDNLPARPMGNELIIIFSCSINLVPEFYGYYKTLRIEDILAGIIFPKVLHFFNNYNIKLWLFEGPIDEKLVYNKEDQPFIKEGLSLNDILQDTVFLNHCFSRSKEIHHYISSRAFNNNRVTSDGICIKSAYYQSKLLNVNSDGERRSFPCFSKGENNIYFFGSCLTFSLFEDDFNTIPSLVQKHLNNNHLSYIVRNYGVKGLNCILNDLLMLINTPMTSGDQVVIINEFSYYLQDILKQNGISIYSLTEYLNDNQLPPFSLLNTAYHGNLNLYSAVANCIYNNIIRYITTHNEDKIKNHISYIDAYGLKDSFKQISIIRDIFLSDYLKYIKNHRYEKNAGDIVACIGMAANPFTNGHARLIDTASKECDFCYVFVIQEDDFEIPYKLRIKMVESYVKNISNCIVLPTGNFWGASFQFPEYHTKDKSHSMTESSVNPKIDIDLFGKFIAPELGITRRYFGEETTDIITREFNDYALQTLPALGVDVKIIPRFKSCDNIEISGSKARMLIKNKSYDELSKILPEESLKEVMRYYQNQGVSD